MIAQWRPWLTTELEAIGLEVVPSKTNFILVEFPETEGKTAAEAEAFLASNGLLVRPVGFYGLGRHLRITIGLEEHNRAVVKVLRALMAA